MHRAARCYCRNQSGVRRCALFGFQSRFRTRQTSCWHVQLERRAEHTRILRSDSRKRLTLCAPKQAAFVLLRSEGVGFPRKAWNIVSTLTPRMLPRLDSRRASGHFGRRLVLQPLADSVANHLHRLAIVRAEVLLLGQFGQRFFVRQMVGQEPTPRPSPLAARQELALPRLLDQRL